MNFGCEGDEGKCFFRDFVRGEFMTTHEFLEYASNQPLYNHYHGFFKNGELEEFIAQNYSSGGKPEKVVELFTSVGWLAFERDETNSDDTLTIDLHYSIANFFWEDIGCAVNSIGAIDGSAGRIEKLYISEEGRFYNQDHILIAQTKEEFFYYLTSAEFDFHPKIRQREYIAPK